MFTNSIWINILVGLSRKIQREFINKLTNEQKGQIFNSIKTLTEILKLDKVDSYEERVILRENHITKYPHVVFWDYVEYQCFGKDALVSSKDFIVSTEGVVIRKSENGLYIYGTERKHVEDYFRVKIDGERRLIHRITASTFITKPDELKSVCFSELMVNHKDTITHHNNRTNLEWVKHIENIRHGHGHENYKGKYYFKLTVALDNGFKGREFVLDENDEVIKRLGVGYVRRNSIRVPNYLLSGMSVTLISEEESKGFCIGWPDDIKTLLKEKPEYFNPDIKPVIGTILKGPHKGLNFSLFGMTETIQFFDFRSVSEVSLGKRKSHRGCSFVKASMKEAIKFHGNLTLEIYSTIQ